LPLNAFVPQGVHVPAVGKEAKRLVGVGGGGVTLKKTQPRNQKKKRS